MSAVWNPADPTASAPTAPTRQTRRHHARTDAAGSTAEATTSTTPSSATEPEAEKKPSDFLGYPFPYYLLELARWRRLVERGPDHLEAGQCHQPVRRDDARARASARTRARPAFRGRPPSSAPDPVIDASGGIVAGGGGSDYRATGFGGSPVLSAPIVAIPMPPPAAARFPAFPPAAAPGVGAAAARGGTAEPAMTASAVRQAGTAEQAPAGPLASMSGQLPRRGYTDYLRSPGLPQLAGAALPGVAGILLMTFGGAVVGYRQASAGRMIRSSAAARYLP